MMTVSGVTSTVKVDSLSCDEDTGYKITVWMGACAVNDGLLFWDWTPIIVRQTCGSSRTRNNHHANRSSNAGGSCQ